MLMLCTLLKWLCTLLNIAYKLFDIQRIFTNIIKIVQILKAFDVLLEEMRKRSCMNFVMLVHKKISKLLFILRNFIKLNKRVDALNNKIKTENNRILYETIKKNLENDIEKIVKAFKKVLEQCFLIRSFIYFSPFA